LWTWPGPNATSTNGNCANTWSLTDCAQHPPTPMTRSGRALERARLLRCAMKRSSAFSRIEQVLKRMRSASRGSAPRVAERLEHALHPLGVVLVHLAPEGGDVVALHRAPKGTSAVSGSSGRSTGRRPRTGCRRRSARRRGRCRCG
jgi:hypothetical protein